MAPGRRSGKKQKRAEVESEEPGVKQTHGIIVCLLLEKLS